MDMNLKEGIIFQEKIEGNKLIVTVEMKIRSYARDPKISVEAADILPLLEKRHEIEKILSSSAIHNFKLKGFKNDAVWEFQLKEKKPRKKRTRRTQNKEEENKEKKDLTSNSFRSRISNIAKK